MKGLPVELVGAVVENIPSISDLLSLRSVNSACHDIVTPHALRRLHVHNSVQGAHNCQSILDSPSLSAHVREIIYDQRNHAQFCLLPAGAAEDSNELEIADLEDALTETFCALGGFKNLESIVLNFWPSYHTQNGTVIQEQPYWFTNRQVAVLHAVHHAIQSSSVRSLTLNNVILMSSSRYDFVSAVTNSPLRHFSMSVIANSELGSWSGSKALNGSLDSLLPVSNANLKSLVLRSPGGLYHSLKTQLSTCNYPSLETLVLENIVFDPMPSADGIEEFIIRNKTRLQRLELHGCSSYVSCRTSPIRRWSTIWKRFEEELTSLREIVVGDTHQGYAFLDGIHGYIPHPSPSATPAQLAQEDEVAYVRFSDRVNSRLSTLRAKCL